MIFVIIVNIILIIWLYKRYIYVPSNYQGTSIEIDELDPALLGYIENEDGNPINWILAEILDLNRKGYIEIEYFRNDIDDYEYIMRKKEDIDITKLKKYELTAYRYLFCEHDTEVSMSELEERILKSIHAEKDIHVKSFSIRNEIEEELIEKNIVSPSAKAVLNILKKGYMILILIIIFKIKNIQLTQGIILFIQSLLVVTMIFKAKPFSREGKILYSKVKRYKKELEYNELLKEKKIMHNILLEKVYANSIALNIMTEAKKEFIHDELIKKSISKTAIDIAAVIYLMIYVIMYGAVFFIGK